MGIRENFSIRAYLVIGPENTMGRPVGQIVSQALRAGFTCVQVRSKVSSARELIDLCGEAAAAIAAEGKSDTVPLLVDDRLDVVLAAVRRASRSTACMWGSPTFPWTYAASTWDRTASWGCPPARTRCWNT